MSDTPALPTISPRLVEPFADAVREVLRTMTGIDPVVGPPHVKRNAAAADGVCGIILFYGQVTGSVVLRFSTAAAEGLVEAFTGMKLRCDHPDFVDAVGELANMVAGNAKQRLNRRASISTPRVAFGGYSVPSGDVPCLVIPCGCPHGVFAVEVSLKANAKAA